MVMRVSRRRNRLLDWVFWLTCVCVWSLLVVMSMVMLVTRLCGLLYAEIIVESNSRNNYG